MSVQMRKVSTTATAPGAAVRKHRSRRASDPLSVRIDQNEGDSHVLPEEEEECAYKKDSIIAHTAIMQFIKVGIVPDYPELRLFANKRTPKKVFKCIQKMLP